MMRILLIFACCLLATGAFSDETANRENIKKRNNIEVPQLVAVASDMKDTEDNDEEEPKRLVCYFNFETKGDPKNKGTIAVIQDKSGYDNNGDFSVGGEILKYSDKDFTCNQAARLWQSEISFKGDLFQAKPRKAITIAAWIKLEEKPGQHSIFDTIGARHSQGQFHFEINDGVLRWFHRNECRQQVFETMAHTVAKDKWTHVAGTYDSKTKQAKVFINGALRNQSIGDGELSRDWAIHAGIGNHMKHRPLKGSIDEFRIYNYALKSDEIKALVGACRTTGDGTEGRSELSEQPTAAASQEVKKGVLSKSIPRTKGSKTGAKRQNICQDTCVAPPCANPCSGGDNGQTEDDEEDDEPKRLVVYFNFEKVMRHGRVSDKSGYENSGTMQPGGEILKFNDPDYTCNQAARLWDHDIVLRGDTFQAKPKFAITIAAWIKLEEKAGMHSVFDTIGASHMQGQFHFEVNDGVVRWFHRNEHQKVVFESMARDVSKGKWAHIAGTYDSKTKQAKIFINGEIRNQSIGDGPLSRDWGVRAGIGNKEKGRPLRGSIDEFRIYNYALKVDEIKALVSACKAGGGATDNGNSSGDAAAGTTRTLVPIETKSTSEEEKKPTDDKIEATKDTGGTEKKDTVKADEKEEPKAVLRK